MGDQPTRRGAGDRTPPDRSHRPRPRADRPGASPITVDQLLARGDVDTGRHPAVRPGPPADDAPPTGPAGRRPAGGLPPVPSGARPPAGPRTPSGAERQPGLPPVPGSRSAARPRTGGERSGAEVPGGEVSGGEVSGGEVPGGEVPGGDRSGLPPVPGAGRPLPGGPPPADARPVRRTGPVPPLPGLAPPPPTGRRRPEPRPLTPARRRVRRAALALVTLVGIVALYHLGLYVHVDRSIERVDALATDGPEVLAAQLQSGAQNYLVVGTGVPGQEGPTSVTALLVSVTADAGRAVLVSLPPTALLDTPACRTAGDGVREPRAEAFAASLLDGGPGCMVRAVQQMSGLRVDHYLGVDLARMPAVVDTLGGVPVCLPGVPADAGVPQGSTEVSADTVDAYLRPGDAGTDVTGAAVAQRAQVLLTSTVRTALSRATLTDPLALTRFLTRAAGALTVDEHTNLGDLRTLAASLGSLPPGSVQRAELPVAQVGYVPSGTDQAYVLVDGDTARGLFDEVIRDTRVPEDVLAAQAEEAAARAGAQARAAAGAGAGDVAGDAPPAGTAAVLPPAQVTVDVLNGTGTTGLAATAADEMRAVGFTVGEVGNEPGTVETTLVRHGPGGAEPAATVARAVPGAVLQPVEALGDAVQLVLGPGYPGVVPVEAGAPPAPPAPEPAPAPLPAAQPVVARC